MALTKISGSILKDPLNLGEVSIGGTLTYQDVTNVDSIGLGTFRSGINVSGGQLDVGSNIKIGNAGIITATELDISGDIDVDGHTNLDNVSIAGVVTATGYVTTGVGDITIGGELNLTNNGNKNRFIDSSLNDGEALHFRSTQGGDTNHENMAQFHRNGSVKLFFDNVEKLATSANGINVSGITTSGSGFMFGTDGEMYLYKSAANTATLRITSDGPYAEFKDVSGDVQLGSASGTLRLSAGGNDKIQIHNNGNVIIGSGVPDGKLHIDAIGSGDIVAELTSGSPTFTYRNGSGSWMHAGKHPTANEFIISEGGTTTGVEMLRIQGGGGATNSKFKFPSVESPSAHGHSTADVEIGGRHIWKRITSANHVTTSTSTNHFYLAFWRSESGSQRTCYYKGVIVNVVASGNYDWGGHGYVTHSSQTLLAFSSTTGGTARFLINEGYNYINNTNGGTNMKINSVSFSHDSTYLYANFKFTTNISGTGFKPHYNIEVIDPNQCTYTCVAF